MREGVLLLNGMDGFGSSPPSRCRKFGRDQSIRGATTACGIYEGEALGRAGTQKLVKLAAASRGDGRVVTEPGHRCYHCTTPRPNAHSHLDAHSTHSTHHAHRTHAHAHTPQTLVTGWFSWLVRGNPTNVRTGLFYRENTTTCTTHHNTPTSTARGWRFDPVSPWRLDHPWVPAGHPRYTGAVTTEGHWWLNRTSTSTRHRSQTDEMRTRVASTQSL